jgi:hypothetical protein
MATLHVTRSSLMERQSVQMKASVVVWSVEGGALSFRWNQTVLLVRSHRGGDDNPVIFLSRAFGSGPVTEH